MSPSSKLATRYIFFTSSNWSARPRLNAWNCRFVYWPPTDKYKYNKIFVRRRSTNRPGAPYNNNNKSVRTIKQNSFKSFLEYVSVSNVIRWQSVPGGRTGVVETTFAKLCACFRQYVLSRVTRSESVPVPAWRDHGDTVTHKLANLACILGSSRLEQVWFPTECLGDIQWLWKMGQQNPAVLVVVLLIVLENARVVSGRHLTWVDMKWGHDYICPSLISKYVANGECWPTQE